MNIYDIAREAGVSIATISRVINGKDVVSEKTKNKVDEILKKYNYTPSEIARGLVVNSIRTVGVMTVDIRDVYYAHVAYRVEHELSKLGYNVILCNTGNDSKEKVKYMDSLMKKKVDGIILVGSVFKDESLDQYISEIAEKIPVVMINGHIDSKNIYSVICDDAYGTSSVVDYVTGNGRRAPVYLWDRGSYSSGLKAQGFKEGIKKNNLEIRDNSIVNVEKGLDGGYDGVNKLIENHFVFDAVVCGDDLTAIGAIKALKKHGISVPEQVAVVGFDNSMLALCSEPSLTSVDSMMEDMGRCAVDIFSRVMDGEKVKAKKILKPKIVVRDSG